MIYIAMHVAKESQAECDMIFEFLKILKIKYCNL